MLPKIHRNFEIWLGQCPERVLMCFGFITNTTKSCGAHWLQTPNKIEMLTFDFQLHLFVSSVRSSLYTCAQLLVRSCKTGFFLRFYSFQCHNVCHNSCPESLQHHQWNSRQLMQSTQLTKQRTNDAA